MLSTDFSKHLFYHLKEIFQRTLGNEQNFIANASNFSAIVFYDMEGVSWAGFYFLSGNDLVLGPHQGKTACVRIPLTNGVCGVSFRNRKPIIVADVHNFPGYIPCDPIANSELVVPIFYNNSIIGVFDIDSPRYNRFTNNDVSIINELLKVLITSSDVEPLLTYYAV